MIFQVLAFLNGYLVIGWYVHSLLYALLLRHLRNEWALLVTLVLDALSMNLVGTIRSIVGILRLPVASPPES